MTALEGRSYCPMLQMDLLRIRDVRNVCKITQHTSKGEKSHSRACMSPRPPLYRKSLAMESGNRPVVQKGTNNTFNEDISRVGGEHRGGIIKEDFPEEMAFE